MFAAHNCQLIERKPSVDVGTVATNAFVEPFKYIGCIEVGEIAFIVLLEVNLEGVVGVVRVVQNSSSEEPDQKFSVLNVLVQAIEVIGDTQLGVQRLVSGELLWLIVTVFPGIFSEFLILLTKSAYLLEQVGVFSGSTSNSETFLSYHSTSPSSYVH